MSLEGHNIHITLPKKEHFSDSRIRTIADTYPRRTAPPDYAAIAAESNKRDAARYEWLRNRAFLNSDNCAMDWANMAAKLAFASGAEFDAIIDAEMAKEAK